MADNNFRVQFVRGTTAEMDDYLGRDGEIAIDRERKNIRVHNGVDKGGDVYGPESVTVEVDSWAGSNWTAPLGVVVTKAYSGSSIRIKHNKGKYPTGWFAFNRNVDPMVGINTTPTRNIHIVDENEVIITDVSSFTKFNVSINFG